jgi:hypothetical protein
MIIFAQSFCSFSQKETPLKEIEPKLGSTPDISEKAKQAFLKNQEIYNQLSERSMNYSSYEAFEADLSKSEMEIWRDEARYTRESLLDISIWGCSWYCGGGPSDVYTSSDLQATQKNNYVATNIHDGNLGTAWVEGKPGLGIGESFSFVFEKKSPPVTTVMLYNGYLKSDQVWKDNGRVKQLKLYVDNKPAALLNLKDVKSQQIFNIDTLQGIDTSLVLRFEITQVYKGDKYEDVAISDIEFDGTGVHCFVKGTSVLTPTGKAAIQNLKTGDEVLSFNEQTGEIETAVILEVASQKHHNLYELDFSGTKITVTDDHPLFVNESFYAVKANSIYGIKANELNAGQEIQFYENGEFVTRKLISIKKLESCQETYTIAKLDKNRLFFANGIFAAVEDLKISPAKNYPEASNSFSE